MSLIIFHREIVPRRRSNILHDQMCSIRNPNPRLLKLEWQIDGRDTDMWLLSFVFVIVLVEQHKMYTATMFTRASSGLTLLFCNMAGSWARSPHSSGNTSVMSSSRPSRRRGTAGSKPEEPSRSSAPASASSPPYPSRSIVLSHAVSLLWRWHSHGLVLHTACCAF